MINLNATSKPSSSGARITGDDLQHLIAWYWCLRAIAEPARIRSIAVEADGVGNLDDVTVSFADGASRYIQVKATVSGANSANLDWLLERAKRSKSTRHQPPSLLQKLFASWCALSRPTSGLELITGRPLDGSDVLLRTVDRRNSVGASLRRADAGELSRTRSKLATHLGCGESEVCDFLDALEIRTGQNEAEWLTRIADVAGAAGIRSDNNAVQIGLGWIRTWVKDTRDPRAGSEIAAAAAGLGLRVEDPRTIIVVRGLREESTDGAQHVLDWVAHFRGDQPSNRRGLVNPADWNGALTNDLVALRNDLVANKIGRVLVRGALRMPCWFAVGAALPRVAGFDLAVEYQEAVWHADPNRTSGRTVVVLQDEIVGDGRTLLVVAISTDRTDDVRGTLYTHDHGRLVTITVEHGPHQALLTDANDALSAAISIRDWVRANVRNSEIDLVLMSPAPFAAFLGWCWDRMPTTTIHEDLMSGYEAAFTLGNVASSPEHNQPL